MRGRQQVIEPIVQHLVQHVDRSGHDDQLGFEIVGPSVGKPGVVTIRMAIVGDPGNPSVGVIQSFGVQRASSGIYHRGKDLMSEHEGRPTAIAVPLGPASPRVRSGRPTYPALSPNPDGVRSGFAARVLSPHRRSFTTGSFTR